MLAQKPLQTSLVDLAAICHSLNCGKDISAADETIDALEIVLDSSEFENRLKEETHRKEVLQVLLSTLNNFGSQENKNHLDRVQNAIQTVYFDESQKRKDLLVEFGHRAELIRMISDQRKMKSKNREVWGHLMRSLIHEFNKRSLTISDICAITLDLHISKLRSSQVFKCIVEYCGAMDFTSRRFVQEAGL